MLLHPNFFWKTYLMLWKIFVFFFLFFYMCPHKISFPICASAPKENFLTLIAILIDESRDVSIKAPYTIIAILIDESCDLSIKEQMTLDLRYVDNHWCVIKWVLGIVHILETTVVSIKVVINVLIPNHRLSINYKIMRAGNIHGELNGLKTIIMKENKFACLIDFLVHQLQLALDFLAKKSNPNDHLVLQLDF